MIQVHAPTASIPGKKPSFSIRSNRLISSTDVAREIASRTLSASSLDMSLPALPLGAGLGSSVVTGGFDE